MVRLCVFVLGLAMALAAITFPLTPMFDAFSGLPEAEQDGIVVLFLLDVFLVAPALMFWARGANG